MCFDFSQVGNTYTQFTYTFSQTYILAFPPPLLIACFVQKQFNEKLTLLNKN